MTLELIGAIAIAVAIVTGIGAHFITKQNDTPVEQAAEAVLRAKGIEIDFSPDDKDEQQEASESNK